MLKNSSELFKLYKISHTLKLWDISIKSSELCKLYKISHAEQTEQIEQTEQTEQMEQIEQTEQTEQTEKVSLNYLLSSQLESKRC